MATNHEDLDWMPVIGRSLAFLCLQASEQVKRPLVEQAEFLSRLGIPRKEAATLLGTTDESLRVMTRQRAAKKSAPGKTAARSKE
jgi:hypothetical protein